MRRVPTLGSLEQRGARRLGAQVVVGLTAVLLLAACGGAVSSPAATEAPVAQPDAAASQQGPIKIAIIAPITGEAASVGTPQLNFARLAVEQFNAGHGIDIELVEADTELDAARAATQTQRLVEDPAIYAIIGPAGSQEVAAAAPVGAQAGIAMISPSATRPDLTEQGYKHLFRVVPRDDVQGPTNARYMADQLGAKKVWIIDDQSSYATGLADEAEEALRAENIAVVRESVSQDISDFSALVTRMKADGPDVVFVPWQIAANGVLLARQMDEQGVDATLFGGDGMLTEDFIKGAGGATDGAYASFFAPDVTTIETAQPVVDAYTARYGEVGPFGPPAYVATMVALEAIERAAQGGQLARASVLAEVAATQQPNSLMGIPIQFDAKGDIKDASFFLFQVRDGEFVPIK
ncbi:MAG: branched-chain amino acid ABC transporter substrate-binding protein [Chloroflexales bacterium]|nr:branched-chain amino acid ABC transporter substrate-binding protein [Chloroflexales bacterium]